jgi:hypothetical protein
MAIISPRSPGTITNSSEFQNVQALKPEWLRLQAASRVSGISRSRLFVEVVKGSIVSRHLKSPGAKRGIRLINYNSLISFIEGLEQ